MRHLRHVSGPVALIALTLALAGCTGAPSSAQTAPSTVRYASTPMAKTTRSDTVILAGGSPQPTAPATSEPGAATAQAASTDQSQACRSASLGDASSAVVRGTNGLGLQVRGDPAGVPLTVLAEGARLALAGEACLADGRWWTQVQTSAGLTGWAAVDYLAPAGDDTAAGAQALPPATARSGNPTTPSSQAAAAPTAQPAPPTPTKAPVPPPPTATPAPTKPPTTPVAYPPVSQVDPLLRPAYQALVTLPKIGPAFGDIVKKSHVRLAVGDTPGAWGLFNSGTNVITIDQKTLKSDPRAVAAVLAHEITHATQVARGEYECTIPRELEATKVGVNVWESFWSNETPPIRSILEAELGQWLVWLREGGDPGVVGHLREGYKDICAPQP